MIEHTAVVLAVHDSTAHVKLLQASACSSCHAKSMCMSAESQEKEMDVFALEPLQVGDQVLVMVTEKMGWKAVLLAYVAPFVVLIALVAGLTYYGVSEIIAGTAALLGIAVYYILLRLCKGKLQRQFSFTAKRV